MLKMLAYGIIGLLAFSPISWGLKHNGNELPPTPPEKAVKLFEQYGGFYKANTEERKIFLSFDLGYEAGHTGAILDILEKHNAKAIFFLCGNYLQEVDLINRMISNGHMIGNHTDKHKDLPTLSPDGIKKDIMDFQNAFTTQFPNAKPPIFMRPPKGRLDEKMCRVTKECGLKTMAWSIAIKDWGKTPIDHVKSSETLLKRLHPGAIVLLHITNGGMVKTVESFLPKLLESGYTVGNPEEIC